VSNVPILDEINLTYTKRYLEYDAGCFTAKVSENLPLSISTEKLPVEAEERGFIL
jgi:hypothetical protein